MGVLELSMSRAAGKHLHAHHGAVSKADEDRAQGRGTGKWRRDGKLR